MAYHSVICPQCGVKSNLQESSLGTLKKCPNCGLKYVAQRPPFPFVGCMIGILAVFGAGVVCFFVCCGGLAGIAGSTAHVPPQSPISNKSPNTPAQPASISPDRSSSAANRETPTDVIPSPERTPPDGSVPASEVPQTASQPSFDAESIKFPSDETAERTRTFKSHDGNFSVDAVFLALHNEVAYFRKVSGSSLVEVPMEKLSNSDRVWIRRIAAADKKKANH